MKGQLWTAALGSAILVWSGTVVAIPTCYGPSTSDCCFRTTNPPQSTLMCNGEECPDTNISTFSIQWAVSVPWNTVTGARTELASVSYENDCTYRMWYCNGQGTCVEAGLVAYSCSGRKPDPLAGQACGPLPPEG